LVRIHAAFLRSPKKKKKAGRGYDINIKPEVTEPAPPPDKSAEKLPPIQVRQISLFITCCASVNVLSF
jgi:hypothetical protein